MPGTSESSPTRPLLVFGDDGAPAADMAWQWITAHRWPGWQVDTMTADADTSRIEWGSPARVEEWKPSWDRPLPDQQPTMTVRFLRVFTDPRAMLADIEADLMVVGLRSGSYLDAMVTGSTTEWLLHHPPAPLLVVRTPDPVERVLVCADGSDHALSAMSSFTALPMAAAADVTIMAVDDGRVDVEASLESATRALEDRVSTLKTMTSEGTPASAILEVIEREDPELVVLGTRGLTGWRRLRLGSTAASVVRSAPCNSLVDYSESATNAY